MPVHHPHLSKAACLLAEAIVLRTKTGFQEEPITVDDLPLDQRVLERALIELHHNGLIAAQKMDPHGRARPCYSLFEVFDPQVKGWNPRADMAAIARYFLGHVEADDFAIYSDAVGAMGWEERRGNPAVGLLQQEISPLLLRQVPRDKMWESRLIIDPAIRRKLGELAKSR